MNSHNFLIIIMTITFTAKLWASNDLENTKTNPTQENITPISALDSWGSFNLEPIYLFYNYGLGGKLDYFISEKLSLGVEGVWYSGDRSENSKSSYREYKKAYSRSLTELNLNGTIMISGSLNTDGFYLTPAIGQQKERIVQVNSTGSGDFTSAFAKLSLGYQWMMAKNIKLAAGLGGRIHENSNPIIIKDSSGNEVDKISPASGALDLQLGYLF